MKYKKPWNRIYRFKIKRRWDKVCELTDEMVGSTGMIQGVVGICFSAVLPKHSFVQIEFVAHEDMCDDSCEDRPTFDFKYKLRWIRKYAC